jgi:hypothetical protein
MILNLYEVFKNFPNLSKQLMCKDLMFTQYDCPQRESRNVAFKVPDESSNYLAFIGPKIFLTQTEIFLNRTDKVEKFI